MYTCEALNAAGRDQKLVQLRVLGTSCLSLPPRTVLCSLSQPSAPHPSGSTVAEVGSVELDTLGFAL